LGGCESRPVHSVVHSLIQKRVHLVDVRAECFRIEIQPARGEAVELPIEHPHEVVIGIAYDPFRDGVPQDRNGDAPPVGGVGGHEVALGVGVARDEIADAGAEQRRHECATPGRVGVDRVGIDDLADVVHESGDLELDVAGGARREQRKSNIGSVEYSDNVLTANVLARF